VATILLWYLIFVLPLLSLNALIAIMSSTYNKVSRRHRQQQYKEWAQIIGDVVQQWEEKKRTEWERQFYWIHTLTPRKYAASSSSTAVLPGDYDNGQNRSSSPSSSLLNASALDSSYAASGPTVMKPVQEQEEQRKMMDRFARLDLTLTGITRILADVLEPQSVEASPVCISNDLLGGSGYEHCNNLHAHDPRDECGPGLMGAGADEGAGGEEPEDETLRETSDTQK